MNVVGQINNALACREEDGVYTTVHNARPRSPSVQRRRQQQRRGLIHGLQIRLERGRGAPTRAGLVDTLAPTINGATNLRSSAFRAHARRHTSSRAPGQCSTPRRFKRKSSRHAHVHRPGIGESCQFRLADGCGTVRCIRAIHTRSTRYMISSVRRLSLPVFLGG
jgi:hypothetical protein